MPNLFNIVIRRSQEIIYFLKRKEKKIDEEREPRLRQK